MMTEEGKRSKKKRKKSLGDAFVVLKEREGVGDLKASISTMRKPFNLFFSAEVKQHCVGVCILKVDQKGE